jgi:hypothetical protein
MPTTAKMAFCIPFRLYLGSFGTKKCSGYKESAIPPPLPFTWDLLARRRVRDIRCQLSRRHFLFTWDLLARRRVRDIRCQLSRRHFLFTWDLLARRRVQDIGCRLSRRHFPLPWIFWHEDVSEISGVGYPATISLYLGSFGTKTCLGYRLLAIPPPFPFTWDLLAQRRVRDIGVSTILPPFPFTWDLLARRCVRDIGCRLSRRHFPFTWDLLARRRVSDIGCWLSRRHFPLPGIFWHEDVSEISGVGYPAAISLYLGSFGTKTCPGYLVSAIPP